MLLVCLVTSPVVLTTDEAAATNAAASFSKSRLQAVRRGREGGGEGGGERERERERERETEGRESRGGKRE